MVLIEFVGCAQIFPKDENPTLVFSKRRNPNVNAPSSRGTAIPLQ